MTAEVLSASLRLQRPDSGWHRIGAQYLFYGGSPNEWTNDAVSAAVVKSLPLWTPVSLCKMAIAAWVRRAGGLLVSAGGRKALSLRTTAAWPPLHRWRALGVLGAGGGARG